jgi:hypothetical protein
MDFIYEVENALPGTLCDELIERFKTSGAKRAGPTGAGVDPSMKLSVDVTIDMEEEFREPGQKMVNILVEHFAQYFLTYPFLGSINPVLRHQKTGEQTMVTMDNFADLGPGAMRNIISSYFHLGPLNILEYEAGKGGYPHWHSEIFPDTECEALHRMAFFIFYLNDVETGGETEFYFFDQKVKPKKGTLVIAPAGFTHTHRGNVPISGNKYIVTSWLLFNRAGQTPAQSIKNTAAVAN